MGITNFRSKILGLWQPLVGYGLAIGLGAVLLLFKLGSLVPGLSSAERLAQQTGSWSALRSHPFYAPYYVLQNGLTWGLGHSAFSARLASALVGFGAIALFYYMVRSWFSLRVALVTSGLFATSAWFLHSARLADASIMQLGLLAIVAFGTWLRHGKRHPLTLIVGGLLAAGLLYIPGFVWFVVPGLWWQRKVVQQSLRESPAYALISAVLLVTLMVPLAVSFVRDHTLLYSYLGLPGDQWASLRHVPHNLLQVPLQLAWRGPRDAARWLGRLPLLDFFDLILGILGLYTYCIDWRLDRSRLILGSLLLSWLLIGLGGPTTILILLPMCYLLVAGGIAFMVEQWFKVFPLNPFARGLALALLTLALGIIGWYNIEHYFVAWPQTPATRAVFSQSSQVIQ